MKSRGGCSTKLTKINVRGETCERIRAEADRRGVRMIDLVEAMLAATAQEAKAAP